MGKAKVTPFELRAKESKKLGHKITQEEMANLVGIHINTWRKLESGDSNPKYDTLQKVYAYFGIAESDLKL